jgi:hypothetical protein
MDVSGTCRAEAGGSPPTPVEVLRVGLGERQRILVHMSGA